jgi:hypothetical protein
MRDDYNACCRTLAAADPGAGFCPDCGRVLLRCPAPDCRELVTPLRHCPSCVDVRLSLEKGAILEARTGEWLTVPFVIRNDSRRRAVAIKSILRETTGAEQPVPLTWEQIDPQRERAFSVDAGPFERAGLTRLRLAILVASRADDVEEVYVFSGEVAVEVQGADPTQIVQNFNLSGADFGTAGMLVANPHAAASDRRRRHEMAASRTEVPLHRAERSELERGVRGYGKARARMPRDVRFTFAGFPDSDRPADGPLRERPVIRCGRNGRAHAAQPNDLSLRIYDPASGELASGASQTISRRVCDFLLENDRLAVRANADKALSVNGAALAAGETRAVSSGDAFAAPAHGEPRVTFTTIFRTSADLITEVRFQKEPGR